ncbi:hypothetical protein CU098_000644, partial [Rhizopus stolonifer]
MVNSPEATPEASSTPIEQPNSIDEVIALVVSDQAHAHAAILNTLSTQQLLAYTSDGLDPLTVLNPVSHSLAYLYFITARCIDATANNGAHLYELLSHFIQVFDPTQIQQAPKQLTLVGKALLHLTHVLKKPLLALQCFKVAIDRFTCSRHALTSLHAPFLQACITAKAYRFPLDLLNQDIDIIDPKANIQGFLEYYYYGSIVYIANKNFERALDFLSIVISAPTQKTISAIQIAAYKKFVLSSLILEGQVRPLAKYTAQSVEKICRTHAAPYLNLVRAFENSDLNMFHDMASKSSSMFESDKHIGLVKQCFQSLRRKKIKEMTKVYMTVGLDDMANKLNVSTEELELILIEMIHQRQVSASISMTDQHVKMVHFSDEEQQTVDISLEDRIFNLSSLND